MENPFAHSSLRSFARRAEVVGERQEAAKDLRRTRRVRDSAIEKRQNAEKELEGIAKVLADFHEAVKKDPEGGMGILDWVFADKLQEKQKDLEKRIKDIREFEERLGDVVKKDLQTFYDTQLEQWAELPYEKQEIIEQFSGEHLASLDLEDFAFLLKRFPSEMVTHVTRQGVRDHTGHGQHTAGVGEVHHGFEEIVKTGKLHSVIGAWLEQGMEDVCIRQLLHLDQEPTEEEIVDEIEFVFDIESQNNIGAGRKSYADMTALHVAAEEVADQYYGSESGNEIFFAFPSLHIASQHFFHGQLARAGAAEMNDQYIWTHELKGLDISAGIVCIPEKILVDRRTGSRYLLNERDEPEVETELIQRLSRALNDDAVQQTMRAYFRKSEDGASAKAEYAKALASAGITDTDPLYAVCMDPRSSVYFQNRMAEKALRSLGMYYRPAVDQIPAKEYWENYFASRPGTRPSKILYYDGDPTKALQSWKEKHKMKDVKKEERTRKDPTMGFPERALQLGEGESMTHFELFRERVIEVAKEYLQAQEERGEEV